MFGRQINSKQSIVPTPLIFLFGGCTNDTTGYTNAIQRYDGATVSNDTAVLNTVTRGAGASSIGSTAYIFGGWSSSSVQKNSIQKYNAYVLSQHTSNLLSTAGDISASNLAGVIYIYGVFDSGNYSISSFSGTTCTAVAYISDATGILKSPATTLSTNIFNFGGTSGGSDTASIVRFDGATRSVDAATLTTVVQGLSATTLGSNAFTFGGYHIGDVYATIQRYNGTTRTSDGASIVNACWTTATTLGSYAYIMGGFNAGNIIQKYDGTTRTTDGATLAYGPEYKASCTMTADLKVYS